MNYFFELQHINNRLYLQIYVIYVNSIMSAFVLIILYSF